jgi:hypothetical protein
MYGYQDSNDVGPGKQGGKFGLNAAFVTKFEYNPNAGKEGAQQDAIDFTAQVGEREYMLRFFPVARVFGKNGEITDTNSAEYKEEKEKQVALLNATLSDIVKAFVPEESLKAALASPMSSFADYAQVLQRLVQGVPNWQKKPVDIFLEWQYTPKGDNTKSYLQLPKDVKHGAWITASKGPGYKEEKTATHLRYVNEAGDIHPLKRGEWYVGSAFATQTVLDGAGSGASAMQGQNAEATW